MDSASRNPKFSRPSRTSRPPVLPCRISQVRDKKQSGKALARSRPSRAIEIFHRRQEGREGPQVFFLLFEPYVPNGNCAIVDGLRASRNPNFFLATPSSVLPVDLAGSRPQAIGKAAARSARMAVARDATEVSRTGLRRGSQETYGVASFGSASRSSARSSVGDDVAEARRNERHVAAGALLRRADQLAASPTARARSPSSTAACRAERGCARELARVCDRAFRRCGAQRPGPS
jgi:hypothetical protein